MVQVRFTTNTSELSIKMTTSAVAESMLRHSKDSTLNGRVRVDFDLNSQLLRGAERHVTKNILSSLCCYRLLSVMVRFIYAWCMHFPVDSPTWTLVDVREIDTRTVKCRQDIDKCTGLVS